MTVISLPLFIGVTVLQTTKAREDLYAQIKSEMAVLSQDFIKIGLLDDMDQAADLTSKLRSLQPILDLILLNPHDNVVFRYSSDNMNKLVDISPTEQNKLFYNKQYFDARLPVSYQGIEYGSVLLRYDARKYQLRVKQYYQFMFFGIGGFLLAAFFVAVSIQKYFCGPVVRLAQAANEIANSKDYSTRLSISNKDEIGFLYSSFNYFLEKIEHSNKIIIDNEKRLQGLIDIVGSGIISINASHKIIQFNIRAEEIFGYPVEQILGKDLNILLPDIFRERHTRHLNNYSKHGTTQQAIGRSGKIFGLRADGKIFPIDASISRLEHNGEVILTVSIEDVSWRVEVEKELKEYQDHLEELVKERTAALETSNRELEAYSYSIAHDLRTPLRGIISFSQVLIDDACDKLNDDERDSLNRIIKAGSRMSNLIEDILKLSRISRSKLKRVKIDLSSLAMEVFDEVIIGEPEVEREICIEDGLHTYADERLTRVLLQNLIENAVKFSRKTKLPRIEVSKTQIGGQYFFYVKDNGVGIDMTYGNKLFKIFETLQSRDEYEGTGIGLVSTQRIVSRHGGKIWAESENQQGAILYFSLEAEFNPDWQLKAL